jgi:cbb3-type cytochrome oxidase maturation protein
VSVLFLILPLALCIVLAAVVAFVWAARRGQFDDLETPALRMLHDDDAPRRSLPPAGGEDASHAGSVHGPRASQREGRD